MFTTKRKKTLRRDGQRPSFRWRKRRKLVLRKSTGGSSRHELQSSASRFLSAEQ